MVDNSFLRVAACTEYRVVDRMRDAFLHEQIMDGQTVQDFSDVDLESMEFLAQQEEDEILHDRVPSTGDATVGGAHAGPPAAGSIEETGLVEREQV